MWFLRPRDLTDGELYFALERLQFAQAIFGVVVFCGITLEVALAVVHPTYDSLIGRWGRVLADICLASGIIGILVTGVRLNLCQGQLISHSNHRLGLAARIAGEAAERAANANARAAEANKRVAKAELTLERYRARAQRSESGARD